MSILVNPPSSPAIWQNVTWVDAVRGSNTTGLIGRPDYPFATIKAAHDACVATGGQWLVHVRAGAYLNDVGMTSVLVSYWFDPMAILTLTSGNNYAFAPTGATVVTQWGIFGHGTFVVNSTGTGGIVSYTASGVGVVTLNGESINVLASTGNTQTGGIYMFGSTTGPNNGFFAVDFKNISSSANMAGMYLRGGAKYMITGGLINDVTLDGAVDVKAFVQEAHKWIVGPNNFGTPSLRITTNRGMKGSDGTPALRVRTGNLIVRGGCVYSGGGAPSSSQAGILEINSQSNGEAATVNALFLGCTMVHWGTPNSSGSGPIIRYPAFSGAKVALGGCHLVTSASNGASACIATQGAVAQTVESICGGFTSDVAVGANITVRGIAPTVSASFNSAADFP
jgi:hypothetical protein